MGPLKREIQSTVNTHSLVQRWNFGAPQSIRATQKLADTRANSKSFSPVLNILWYFYHSIIRHSHPPSRGATTFSKLGVPFLGIGFYYSSTEKNRQVCPVWCSRLQNDTLFIKKLCKKLGGVQILGRSGLPRPPSGCAHDRAS